MHGWCSWNFAGGVQGVRLKITLELLCRFGWDCDDGILGVVLNVNWIDCVIGIMQNVCMEIC